jgi:cytochrome P450
MVAPELDDMFAPDAIADPYRYYARLREQDPVHWNERYQLWVITRHDDIVWMIRHHELFSSAVIRNDPRPPYPPIEPSDLGLVGYVRQFRADQLVEHDRPEHLAMRQVMHGYFTPRTMESWRPFVRQAVTELLDDAQARGRMDVLTDLAAPLPVRVITQMMGVPPEDREHLRELADKLLHINRGEPDRLRPLTEGMRGMLEYV